MLNKIKENWFFVGVLFVVIIGIYFPFIGIVIKSYIKYLIAFGMFLISLRLDVSHVLKSIKKVRAILLCIGCSFLMMPIISYLLGILFFRNNPIFFAGIIMTGATATTQASSIIWTDQSKGNTNLALVLMTISSLLGIFIMPLILYMVLRTTVDLPVLGMIKSLAVMILLPALVGILVARLFGDRIAPLKKPSKILNVVIILLAVLTAFSSSNFQFSTAAYTLIVAPLHYIIIALISFYSSKLIGLNKKDSIAVLMCSSQKTITFATIIVFTYFEPATLIYLTIYHIFQLIMGQIHVSTFTKHKT